MSRDEGDELARGAAVPARPGGAGAGRGGEPAGSLGPGVGKGLGVAPVEAHAHVIDASATTKQLRRPGIIGLSAIGSTNDRGG
jgi:hypothetical protein